MNRLVITVFLCLIPLVGCQEKGKNVSGNNKSAEGNKGGSFAYCADGTVTYSAGKKGACSHHGGLAVPSTPSSPPTSSTETPSKLTYKCGVIVGKNSLSGHSGRVIDGDTIVLDGEKVRLGAIDAPESSQLFGYDSTVYLEARLSGQEIEVTYNHRDQYGRIVGMVFLSSCELINLTMVKVGYAWYDDYYQCDLSLEMRKQFELAQRTAKESKIGVWEEESPTPPWTYRNGQSRAVPKCSSALTRTLPNL